MGRSREIYKGTHVEYVLHFSLLLHAAAHSWGGSRISLKAQSSYPADHLRNVSRPDERRVCVQHCIRVRSACMQKINGFVGGPCASGHARALADTHGLQSWRRGGLACECCEWATDSQRRTLSGTVHPCIDMHYTYVHGGTHARMYTHPHIHRYLLSRSPIEISYRDLLSRSHRDPIEIPSRSHRGLHPRARWCTDATEGKSQYDSIMSRSGAL